MEWAPRQETGIRSVTLDDDHDDDDETTQPIPDFALLLAASIANEMDGDNSVPHPPVPPASIPARRFSAWTKLSIAAGLANCASATAFIVATISAHAAGAVTRAVRDAAFIEVHRASFASVAAIVAAKPIAIAMPAARAPGRRVTVKHPTSRANGSRGGDIIRTSPY